MGTWEIYSALGLDESGKEVAGAPRVLSLLASVLERSIKNNEKMLGTPDRKDVITIFHGTRPPTMSVKQYIDRIFKYAKCSASCFVLSFIYIDRFIQRTDVYLTSLNVHRLLITSIMVAAKFLDDDCYNNAYYAKVGGVSTAEMNNMEMKFLFTLNFRIHATVEMFQNYYLKLLREGAAGEAQMAQPVHAYVVPRNTWRAKQQ